MSVTFANVTDINIPQGSVTKITDSSGKVLWERDKYANKELYLHYDYYNLGYNPVSDKKLFEFNKDGICISHILCPQYTQRQPTSFRTSFTLEWALYSSSVRSGATPIQIEPIIQKKDFGFEVGNISGVSGSPMNLQFEPDNSTGVLRLVSINSNIANMANDTAYSYLKFIYKPTGISRTFCCKYIKSGIPYYLFEANGDILSKLGLS